MLDLDTFLTTLYVLVDDLIKQRPQPRAHRPGPRPGLSESEVVTLAMLAQLRRFRSERAFMTFATTRLRRAFPLLPDRSQLNRQIRSAQDGLVWVMRQLAQQLGSATATYEVLDGMGVKVRNNRRIARGWLDGIAGTGWSNRLRWYDGFHVLTAVTPTGVLTGYAVAPAQTKEQPYTDAFLAARMRPQARTAMVGAPAHGPYVADRGFEGVKRKEFWYDAFGATVLAPPRTDRTHAWPKDWCQWHAHIRQIVEIVHAAWTEQFRIDDERPHTLDGFLARLAALTAMYNAAIWINRSLGRPDLAFAELVSW